MADLQSTIKLLANQAEGLSAFTGRTNLKSGSRIFLVMGMTGAGKSTFVGQCTGSEVTVGHGLYSCTRSINVFGFRHRGRQIYLVDTPGFNDTDRSDTETLEVLASYLGASYANGLRIHGIVFLYPITYNRMTGSSLRNIDMIKAVCGFTSYSNLAIVTTMWPRSTSSLELVSLQAREKELVQDERFFGALIDQGATLFRHCEKGRVVSSAQHIVQHLIRQSQRRPQKVLRLQREIIDEGKTIGETEAGIAIARDINKFRKESKRHLQQLKGEIGHISKSNATYISQLQELQDEVEKKLAKSEANKRILTKTMRDMHANEQRYWKDKIEDLNRDFRDQLAKKEEELRDMEESIRKLRQERALRSIKRPGRSQDYIATDKEQKAVVEEVRQEVAQTRVSYQKLQSHTGNIVNGSTNGIAAGVTSGTIAALAAGGMLCVVM